MLQFFIELKSAFFVFRQSLDFRPYYLQRDLHRRFFLLLPQPCPYRIEDAIIFSRKRSPSPVTRLSNECITTLEYSLALLLNRFDITEGYGLLLLPVTQLPL